VGQDAILRTRIGMIILLGNVLLAATSFMISLHS